MGMKTMALYGEKADKPFEDFCEYFRGFRDDWIKSLADIQKRRIQEEKLRKMEAAKSRVKNKLKKRPRRETLVAAGVIKEFVKKALEAPPKVPESGRHHSVHLAKDNKRSLKEEADLLASKKKKKKKKKREKES